MDSPVEPATIGSQLKERRQQAGLSLKEVATRTCIRRTYLEALEADRFDLLPGEVYVQGFVRNFAEAVGLEAAPLLAQIRRQKPPALAEEGAPAADQKRLPPVLGWVLLALVIVCMVGGLAYSEWRAGINRQKALAVAAQEQALARAQEKAADAAGPMPAATVDPVATETEAALPPKPLTAVGR
jgi:cytoskeletal protein RodZ